MDKRMGRGNQTIIDFKHIYLWLTKNKNHFRIMDGHAGLERPLHLPFPVIQYTPEIY